MTLSIRTNQSSIVAARSLNSNSAALNQTSQELASGLRINGAADDPAGLAIASLMSSQIAAMLQDQQNIGQGISMLQTVDGALAQQNQILGRLSVLAAESANGVLTDAQRVATIQPEVTSLLTLFDKIGNSASFNGLFLLSGGTTGMLASIASGSTANTNLLNGSAINFQSNSIHYSSTPAQCDTVDLTMDNAGLMTMTWTTATTASNGTAKTAVTTTATANAAIKTAANTPVQYIDFYDSSGNSIATVTIPAIGNSPITLVPTTTQTGVNLTLGSGTSNVFVIQSGTNNDVNSKLNVTVPQSLQGQYALNTISMTTQTTSQTAITTVNVAISSLATVRAGIGATISQLTQAEEFTANNLISAQSALGEIVDADIASASSNLSAQSVLVQAAMSMLAQANKQPEVALTLLR